MPEAFSVEKVNVRKPTVNRKKLRSFTHLQGLEIPELTGGEIEVLLGANVLEAVLQREARVGKPGEPVAIRTAFGWSLTGSLAGLVPGHQREVMFISTSTQQVENQTLSDMMADWWSTESFGTRQEKTVLTPAEPSVQPQQELMLHCVQPLRMDRRSSSPYNTTVFHDGSDMVEVCGDNSRSVEKPSRVRRLK